MKGLLTSRSAPSKDDALDGHALRSLPGRVDDGALAGGGAEPGVGVGARFPILRAPLFVLPRGELDPGGQRLVDALPVESTVAGLGHIGEDGVPLDGLDGVGVGLHRGPRSNAKKSIFWVNSS